MVSITKCVSDWYYPYPELLAYFLYSGTEFSVQRACIACINCELQMEHETWCTIFGWMHLRSVIDKFSCSQPDAYWKWKTTGQGNTYCHTNNNTNSKNVSLTFFNTRQKMWLKSKIVVYDAAGPSGTEMSQKWVKRMEKNVPKMKCHENERSLSKAFELFRLEIDILFIEFWNNNNLCCCISYNLFIIFFAFFVFLLFFSTQTNQCIFQGKWANALKHQNF